MSKLMPENLAHNTARILHGQPPYDTYNDYKLADARVGGKNPYIIGAITISADKDEFGKSFTYYGFNSQFGATGYEPFENEIEFLLQAQELMKRIFPSLVAAGQLDQVAKGLKPVENIVAFCQTHEYPLVVLALLYNPKLDQVFYSLLMHNGISPKLGALWLLTTIEQERQSAVFPLQ